MGQTLVLIDDDEDFLASLKREMRSEVEVIGFSSSEPALEYLKANLSDVDLICVDLQMPDIEGVDWQLGGLNIIQRIKHQFTDGVPPVYALTGMDAMVHIHTCLKNGADDFLEKGPSIRDIAQKLIASKPLMAES